MISDAEKIRDIANKASEILQQYVKDDDGWRVAKKKGASVVEFKRSTCEGYTHGYLYRGKSEMPCSKEDVFKYLNPIDGERALRKRWDKDTKEIFSLHRFDQNLGVIRTMTNSAAMGLISPRDFVDVVLVNETDSCLSTGGSSIECSECPVDPNYVRAWNHPCGLLCMDVPGKPNHTHIITLVQPDIKGMLPRSLVDSAIPGSMIGFFSNLASILKKDGLIK